MPSWDERPLIFSLENVSYNGRLLAFGYVSLQKYFFNIDWQEKNIQTLIYTL